MRPRTPSRVSGLTVTHIPLSSSREERSSGFSMITKALLCAFCPDETTAVTDSTARSRPVGAEHRGCPSFPIRTSRRVRERRRVAGSFRMSATSPPKIVLDDRGSSPPERRRREPAFVVSQAGRHIPKIRATARKIFFNIVFAVFFTRNSCPPVSGPLRSPERRPLSGPIRPSRRTRSRGSRASRESVASINGPDWKKPSGTGSSRVSVIFVDPRQTSRQCFFCGHVDRKKRKSRSDSQCVQWNFSRKVDWNATINIALRSSVNTT